MYIESLIIKKHAVIIRNIKFNKNVNIIADNTEGITVEGSNQTTNSIGKTTVLKLIDICLGADIEIVYTDSETRKNQDTIIKEFIEKNDVKVELSLTKGDDQYVLERNLSENKFYINNQSYTKKGYEAKISGLFFPNLRIGGKPSFRQLCKKNIRADENSINNVLLFLGSRVSLTEYEPLYMFLLGISGINLTEKPRIMKAKKLCEKIIKELSKKESIGNLKEVLKLVQEEISKKEKEVNYYKKEEHLQYEKIASELNSLQSLLRDAEVKLNNDEFALQVVENISTGFNKDLYKEENDKLIQIYNEYEQYFSPVIKAFNQFVEFHTSITKQKIYYNENLVEEKRNEVVNSQEKIFELKKEIDSKRALVENSREFIAFDRLKNDLEKLYVQKGRYEEAIATINDKQEEIQTLNEKLEAIDKKIKENIKVIDENIKEFNEYYSYFSNELYGETYRLLYDFSNGIFKLSSITTSGTSSGKKQGEILCFDMAYILYAREKNIPHIEFILNDKKELLSTQQIMKAVELAEQHDIQLVFSILSDKLTSIYDKVESKIILKLSEKDKLFRI